MRKRNRGGLAKIGLLAIALMVALGVMGIAYSGWTDTVNIANTVSTGTVGTTLSCTGNQSVEVVCGSSGMTLNITVNGAVAGGYYYCDFRVGNSGNIPVKVQNISISSLPSGVHVNTTGVTIDTQIDPALPKTGTVNITVDSDATNLPASFSFTVTFSTKLWNK